MPVQTESRPELAAPAKEVIADTWARHKAGGGTIPMTKLTAGLAGFSEKDHAKIAARGVIKLEPVDENKGRWINESSSEISVKWEGITIKVPEVVKGDYVAFKDECVYIFDSGFALKGCKLIFCVKFERIVVTRNRWTFDVEGESHDVCYTF
jgi:hypothetical protein